MWLAAGSIEIDGRTIHGDEPITAAMWGDVVRSYDPDFREAPIIAAPQNASASAHVAGQYGGQILGRVRAVAFDGIFGWVEFEPTEAYRSTVDKSGGAFPSIAFRRNAELQGSPWYLEHVAALTGEMPATPNLDKMRSLNAATSQGGSDCRIQITRSQEAAVADQEKTKATEAAATEPEEKTKAEAEAAPEEAAPEESADQQSETAEETRAAGATADSVTRAAHAASVAGVATTAQMTRALEALSAKVEAQDKAIAVMRAAQEKREKDAKAGEIKRSLSALAGEGRLRSADIDTMAGQLAAMDDKTRDVFIRSMTAEAPSLGEEIMIEGDDGQVIELDDYRYRTTERASGVDRSVQIEIEKARAASTTKDGKFDQASFDTKLRALRMKGVA
jgi:hypothetical protein